MPLTLLILLIIGVLAAMITAEVLSLTVGIKKVAFRCELNMSLTEPDEVATITYRVRNTSLLPIGFLSFSFLFDEAVEVREDDEWLERHRSGGLFGNMFSFDGFLMPRRVLKGRVHFSLRERGRHNLGKVYIEVGDLLGFKTKVKSLDIPGSMICTARLIDSEPDISALGGFLGDISVRRFIMEDPSLVLGFREYTGNEPMKSISWLQTAKTGRLMVKKHDFTVDTDVAVLMDIEQVDKNTAERCLEILRTVCERLETLRIPYAVHSNGDIFEVEKGGGRAHSFDVQRRIGVSKFVKYKDFASTCRREAIAGRGSRGVIVIAPALDVRTREAISAVETATDIKACVLTGEEAANA